MEKNSAAILYFVILFLIFAGLSIADNEDLSKSESTNEDDSEPMGFYPGQLVLGIYPGFVYPETKPILEDIEKEAKDKLGPGNRTSLMKMTASLGRVEVRYKLVKLLLSISGVWPFLTSLECRISSVLTFVFVTSQLIPQINGFIEITDDLDKVIECLSPFGFVGLCIIKYTNLAVNKDKIRRLLEKIQKDWDHAVFGQENTIMHRYAEVSFKMIIFTLTFSFVLLLPIVESIPTWNPETNMTESKRNLSLMLDYYYIDQYKYFYYLIVYSFITTNYLMLTYAGADALYFILLQHGCAKFSWLNHELSNATDNQLGNLGEKLVYKKVQNCVILHQDAIKFANEIESIYKIPQLFQIGISCILISLCALHAVTKLTKPEDLVIYFGVILGTSIQLFLYSWPSQELMDHSESVCSAAYEMEWYQASIPMRRIVLQIMTRSLDTIKITAGGLYLMSVENFISVLANAISFFTVLSSVQEKLIQE